MCSLESISKFSLRTRTRRLNAVSEPRSSYVCASLRFFECVFVGCFGANVSLDRSAAFRSLPRTDREAKQQLTRW
jgi:hypothetical protein